MRLLFILIPTDCLDACDECFKKANITAYTEIPSVIGSGESGRKLGTRAFPGTTSLLLVAVPASDADHVVETMKEFCKGRACEEETRVFAVPAEQLI
jgi:hypothetical protein